MPIPPLCSGCADDPPSEYDLRVELTRISGDEGIVLGLTHKDQNEWLFICGGVGNTTLGFGRLKDWGFDHIDNPTRLVQPEILPQGRRTTVCVKVRADRFSAVFNHVPGKEYSPHPWWYAGGTEGWAFSRKGLSLGSQLSPTLFQKVELVEVAGSGRRISRPIRDPRLIHEYPRPQFGCSVRRLEFSPDGRSLAVGNNQQIESGQIQLPDRCIPNPVWGIGISTRAFSPDGNLAVVYRANGPTVAMDLGRHQGVHDWPQWYLSVDFSPDGRSLVMSDQVRHVVEIWDVTTWRLRASMATKDDPDFLVFSPDGSLVVVSQPGTVSGFSGKDLKPMWRLPVPNRPTHPSFSSDGRRLLVSAWNRVVLLDVHDGHFLGSFGDVGDSMWGKLSPDGTLAFGAYDFGPTKLYLWRTDTGEELHRFDSLTEPVLSADFSPDGKQVLAGCLDGVARLLDVETGNQLDAFTGHAGGVTAVAFSADGKLIATGCEDGKARIFRLDSAPAKKPGS